MWINTQAFEKNFSAQNGLNAFSAGFFVELDSPKQIT